MNIERTGTVVQEDTTDLYEGAKTKGFTGTEDEYLATLGMTKLTVNFDQPLDSKYGVLRAVGIAPHTVGRDVVRPGQKVAVSFQLNGGGFNKASSVKALTP